MIGAHQSQNKIRRWILVFLRWLSAIFVLAVLFYFLPLAPLRAALAQVPLTRFAAILLGYLLAHSVGIFKWRMVVNAAGSELDFKTSAQCYTGGLFATLFLPSILGGDVVRLAVGLRRSPHPAAVFAGNVADRFLDVTAQAALVTAGLFLLPGSVSRQFKNSAIHPILIVAIVAILLLVLGFFMYRPLLQGRSIRFRRKLARLRHALRSVSKRPHVLVFGWALGILIQSSLLLLTALLAMSCGLFVPLRIWFFAWPLAKLAAVLPLTQGGIGVREAALVGLLAPFGAPGPLVFAAGLAWEGIIIVGGLISGLTAFLLRRFNS